ncbi:MAG TPA: MFS transporter [Planctomycetaceae bacterium]
MNNNRALFLASFFTLIAAGVGFSVRGVILDDWSDQFGFTKATLGKINGGGLVGFGITIIACSLIADRVGYKALMVLAFLLHVSSAIVTLAATPIYEAMGKSSAAQDAAFQCLYWGAFLFSLGNGVCESVINPLVATLYPTQKTHYLNILHAGWPGGLILGGILSLLFCSNQAYVRHVRWEIAVAFFLPFVAYYGYVILKETFPISEAKAAGVSYGTMLAEFASPILILLFLLHACVGYVELGTDSWIQNIMTASIGNLATWLFIWTSGLMFALRFFAGPIVEKINPIGLLFISAVLGCAGLVWLGTSEGLAIMAAGTVYGIGKTFYWPTMLGVVGERYPKGGALTMGTIGGIGMLSAGLLGGPGIGYTQDYFAAEKLEAQSPKLYDEYVSKAPFSESLNKFVDENQKVGGEWPKEFGNVVLKPKTEGFMLGTFKPVAGLDGTKVGDLGKKDKKQKDAEAANKPVADSDKVTEDERIVLDANMYSGRMALKTTAYVPAAMAIGYLVLALYFRSKGGYQVEVLHGAKPVGEHYTGGTEGPGEG